MFELIKQYLKNNGINDFTLFSLANEGSGDFIKTWGYEIEQPSFTNTQCKISNKKIALIFVRKKYLEDSDWQACAFIKYGRPLDSGLAEKCQLAKDEINAIEIAPTLTALNTFSTTFE